MRIAGLVPEVVGSSVDRAWATLLNTSVDAKDAKKKYQGRKESMKASCSFPPLLNFERVDVPKTPFGLSLAKPCSHRDFAHQPFDRASFPLRSLRFSFAPFASTLAFKPVRRGTLVRKAGLVPEVVGFSVDSAWATLLNTSVDAMDAKKKYQGRKGSMKASCSFPPLLNFERVDVPKTPFGLSLAKPARTVTSLTSPSTELLFLCVLCGFPLRPLRQRWRSNPFSEAPWCA